MLRYGHHQNIVTLRDVRTSAIADSTSYPSPHPPPITSIILLCLAFQVYEDDRHVFLVMELMKGGELLDRLKSLKYFSEREASSIMYVIVSAVHYLHQNGVS